MAKVQITKRAAAWNNYGHFGRNAMLAREEAARWNVLVDGELEGILYKAHGCWNFYKPETGRVIESHWTKARLVEVIRARYE